MTQQVSAQEIKELRERTGAGISQIKKALEDAKGDMGRAEELITERLGGLAGKRAGRETSAGLVECYAHSNGKIGAMVELLCETDFVARNPAFKELAHDVAMHIAAMRPLYGSFDMIPSEVILAEKNRFSEEAAQLGKPGHLVEQIVEGKLKAHFSALTLHDQPFIKDQDKTVGEMLNEAIGRFGENLKIGRFARFEI